MFRKELEALKENRLLREIKDRGSAQGARINIKGRVYINFGSNDYLGLASHPHVAAGAKDALEKFGAGAGASRLLAGGTSLSERLESLLADFKEAEKALVFNSGYCMNTGVIPALADEEDAVFSDELNHASIIDGCRLSKAKKYIYRHSDVSHLRELLRGTKARKKIIVTDAVFSMDGDIAPIEEICGLCASGSGDMLLYMDDAHGTGVLGKGRGTLRHFGIKPEPWIIQMGTMSKAMGSFGAFAAGDGDSIGWLLNSARSLIFSTALPPSAVGASIAALEVIWKDDKGLVDKLWDNRDKLMNELAGLGLDTGRSETPIIPLIMKDVESTAGLSDYLYKEGIYAPAIRPPAVRTPRVRLTVTAAHTEEEIGILARALHAWREKTL
ncbi:MAG: pyridoxal phosphate-dependent aminotransferase family protein [Thermodesulfovibrionales bacterium]|nr:pyridoxal phosphate-dependent aminotransferase family protein [Thermodesulfovibrionales bacterium]